MGHWVGSKLCLPCHKLEDHEHVFRHFVFDTTRKAFGSVQREGGGVEPSWLPSPMFAKHPGSVLCAAMKAQWAICCEAHFSGSMPPLDDFVARWLGILEVWRSKKDMSLSQSDLQRLIEQLLSWFEGGMFQKRQQQPRLFPRKSTVKSASSSDDTLTATNWPRTPSQSGYGENLDTCHWRGCLLACPIA